ncbi:MAG: quinone oxidoreductase [Deltaproteobacteria bacterium]|nr:quinone oxidoreductase [Deltaproteobacteria bacterium]MBW2384542.1 quinone oxidoreductase [Deltaproteobacteria bacterium]MBW2697782.1 quinone oxidoreductase [Deltaproteobacteria bacterium]
MITAIRVEKLGGPEVLAPARVSVEPPGAGQVTVEVAACGVNFIDVYFRTGLYPRPLPFVPGLEGAGRISHVGQDVGDLAVGDRVAWSTAPGSYASTLNAAAPSLVRVPDGVDDDVAAAVMLQGMTSHYLVHGVRTTEPGDTALVHAAAGGVGLLLIQMLTAVGARVIGTCSTEEKAALARAAGAEEIVRYDRDDFAQRVREWTSGRGVDVVYDSVGMTTFEGSLASLRPRGLLCLFGQSSGVVAPFDLGRLNGLGSLFVTRPSLAHYTATREELELRAGAVLGAVASGDLDVRIGARFDLADAAEAHRALEGRLTTGKVLLIP